MRPTNSIIFTFFGTINIHYLTLIMIQTIVGGATQKDEEVSLLDKKFSVILPDIVSAVYIMN